VQSVGEQSQADYSSHCDQPRPRGPEKPPERVADDRCRETRVHSGFVSRAAGEENRLSRSGEKRLWIALGQTLDRALSDLGADENELGMHLPQLDVRICSQSALIEERGFRLNRWGRSRGRVKPVLQTERSFAGDGSQTAKATDARHPGLEG
jgi:hypothetical protein